LTLLCPFADGTRTALKAARKTRSGPASDDESDEVIELSDSTSTPPPSDESEPEDDDSDGIVILDGPPVVTIPLPQLVKKEEPAEALPVDSEPPPGLLHALSNPLLDIVPCIRLSKTKRLPFLRRTLRVGFKYRCDLRGIPTGVDREGVRDVRLEISYRSAGNADWKETKNGWSCPFCDLFGGFSTKEMFETHLKWDHSKIYHEWAQVEAESVSSSFFLLPETDCDYAEFCLVQTHHCDSRACTSRSRTAGCTDRSVRFQLFLFKICLFVPL